MKLQSETGQAEEVIYEETPGDLIDVGNRAG